MKTAGLLAILVLCNFSGSAYGQQSDGSVLPFPPTPSASQAGPTLQEAPGRTKTAAPGRTERT